MKQEALEILYYLPVAFAIALAALFFIQLPPVQRMRMIKWKYRKHKNPGKDIPLSTIRIKPFDCESCISFWVSLIILYINKSEIYNMILLPLSTAQLTKYLKR